MSSSENPIKGVAIVLALLDSLSSTSAGSLPTDITLKGLEPVLPGAARMTFIVPMGGLNVLCLVSVFDCSCHPTG